MLKSASASGNQLQFNNLILIKIKAHVLGQLTSNNGAVKPEISFTAKNIKLRKRFDQYK